MTGLPALFPANHDDAVTGSVSLPIRLVIVTNIPAPYRLPIYNFLAQEPDIDLHVVFCSGREPDREWNLGQAGFAHTFLNQSFVRYRGRFIHINHDVWSVLLSLRPDVVVTTGFNPTHLLAYAWARLHGARHVAMTDGTLESEARLTALHRWIRRHVYVHTAAFIAASDGGMRLYRSYGIEDDAMFKSHLCADNALFFDAPPQAKRYDLMFCGRFEAVKNPFFALDVARETARRLGRRVSIVFVGSGGLEAGLRAYARNLETEVETVFAGFARQEALPAWYGASRVFLFPTQWDPWGVVANEACAAGVPVLVTEAAGAANELVRDGENGYVLPLDLDQWAGAAVRLLTDASLVAAMATRCRAIVDEYNYVNAARGIAMAVRSADRAWLPWSAYKSRAHPKVLIIQRRMTHYRLPLFNLMREKLRAAGVDLGVVYGDPLPEEKLKNDAGELPWSVHVPCRYWLNGRLCWQNAMPVASNANLVIVTQENRLLFNYVRPILKRDRLWAFWGHGRNFQSATRNSWKERFKRWLARHVDWWFAYTSLSAEAVVESGFPLEKVTVLNNAIDTAGLAAQLASVSPEEVERARRGYGIGPGPVGLSLASLHADKRLDFLLDTARRIRARVPDFRLVLVGDGPQRDLVRRAAEAEDWIHWLGARSGREKALVLSMSSLMLNPGMVGLSILDALVAGVPMVTTAYPHHSPEIAYLHSGLNGLVTEDDPEAFADGVVRLLGQPAELEAMRAACLESAGAYTIERMAENFCSGILACLGWQERQGKPVAPHQGELPAARDFHERSLLKRAQ
jgi:glycosyltransferase involved in cell wall biosynthesis